MNAGISRRSFLTRTVAVTTTAGMIAAAPVWALRALGQARAATRQDEPGPTLSAPLVAYVRDAHKGEVVLMVGTKEVVRRDPHLVACLARAVR